MYNFNGIYPDYDVAKDGTVYKNGKEIKPFKSNKYMQVLLFDVEHKRKICGVHTIVAMKYLDYYDGCIVHHIDGNTHNNCVDNLEVYSRVEHSAFHSKGNHHNKGQVPWNKRIKMSEEFCKKCSESAKNRKDKRFNGNQYVDAYGNRK